MSARQLFAHQDSAIGLLRNSIYRLGKRRPMLCAPTGFGKTFTAATIISRLREHGDRILFIVNAVSLIDQAVEDFTKAGLTDIGVIQANHPMTDWSKPLQVASVQTLRRRGFPRFDLAFVDEAHDRDQWLEDQMASDEFRDVPFIGMSATPWAKGMGLVWDDLLIPASLSYLIETINPATGRSFLKPFRVFAPSAPDLSKVGTQAGEYHQGQLGSVVEDDEGLIADIVSTWKLRGENRPTIAFAVNRAHAKKLQERFTEAGVGCGYIDAYTERTDRLAIRRQLDSGEFRVVVNVGTLVKGVDWVIACIIDAAPTKSLMRYVQKFGRGLRDNPPWQDLIYLDHASNTTRLGFPTDIHKPELCTAQKGEKAKKEAENSEPLPKACPSCSFLKPPKVRKCPVCSFEPTVQSAIEEQDGELIEVTTGRAKATMEEKAAWFGQLNWIRREKGYAPGWAAQQYRKRFDVWPNQIDKNLTYEPTPEVRSWVKSQQIRFAKSRQAKPRIYAEDNAFTRAAESAGHGRIAR